MSSTIRLFLIAACFTAVAFQLCAIDTGIWKPRFVNPAIVAKNNPVFTAEVKSLSTANQWKAVISNDMQSWPCAVSAAYGNINRGTEGGWVLTVTLPGNVPPELFTLAVSSSEGAWSAPRAVSVVSSFDTDFYILHLGDEQIVNSGANEPAGTHYGYGSAEECTWNQEPINLINPRFVMATGDHIDFNGALDGWNNWYDWGYSPSGTRYFSSNETCAIEKKLTDLYLDSHRGYTVPFVLTPGNHDVTPEDKLLAGTSIKWHTVSEQMYEKYFGERSYSFRMGSFYVLMHDFSDSALKTWTANEYANSWSDSSIIYRLLGVHWNSGNAYIPSSAKPCDMMLVGHGHTVKTVTTAPYYIYESGPAFRYGTTGFFNFKKNANDWTCDQIPNRDTTNTAWGLFTADGAAKKVSVSYAAANNGTAAANTASINNDLPQTFYDGRIRFLLKKGTYAVTGGVKLAEYDDATGTKTAVLVKVNIVKNASTTVSVSAYNPVATVSGAPASFSTNRTFSIGLDVDRNYGYWSTNASTGSTGSPTGSAQAVWNQFTTSGVTIVISQTTTLRVYGAGNGVSGATNTYTYTIDTTAPAVSGAPANLTTNKQFTVSLDADGNYGYFSTNGSTYAQFGTSGTNIVINGTTTLSYFGRDVLGNTSVTNTRTYTFDTTAPVVSGAPAGMTTNRQFTISLDVNENYGYFSTNASAGSAQVAWYQFTTAGTNMLISRTTTLSYYGRDALGNTGAVNVRTYTIGLIAHWKFDETMGLSAADAGGYGHTAYLSNMASPACWSAGKLSNALSFGNTDDYIKAENTSALSALGSNNADLSVAYFMRLSNGWNGAWRHIMHKGNTLLERTFSMFLNPSNNRLHYRISTTSNFSEGGDSASEIPLGTWVHVAYVKQGSVLSVYFNGVKNSSVKLRGAVINNNGPVFIGRDPEQAGPSMTLDDVRVYNRALGSNEIASLAAAGGTTTVLAAMPAGKIAGGSAQIDPMVKNVGLSYTVNEASSPATALAMSIPSGMAIDDGGEASGDIEMQFFYAPAGATGWREIDPAYLDGSMVHVVTGMYRNTWRLPADFDLSKQYDVMIGGTRGGIPLIPYIVTGVDVTRVVTVRTTLDGFFALNSPCRGAGVISFANLTKDATVTIYSVSGKKIAELSSADRDVNGIISWNVASNDGRRVSPGVYLCRATSSAGSKTIRVMVLR